jgi:RNA polymerase-binding protein DksA
MNADTAKKLLSEEKARLQQLRDGLAEETQQSGAGGEDVSELSSVDQHPADVGTEEFEREKDLSILESLEAELVSIEQAFERLDAGSYGKCDVCGKDIGDERLEARPAATLCIEHQQEAERATQ